MLLINGVIALIGVIVASIVVHLKMFLGLHGLGLIGVCFLGLWVYLFVSDVIEDWMVEKFNKSPA